MTVLEGVPVDRITAEAHRMRASAAILAMIAAPLYLLGKAVFWLLLGLALGAKWIGSAAKIGYLDARTGAESRGVTIPARLAGRAEVREDLGTD